MRIRTNRKPRLAASLLLPLALLLAAGCQFRVPGASDGPTAQQIFDRATQASESARSVRVHGKLREGGDVYGIDLRIANKDTASATITLRDERMKLIRIHSDAYIQGNARFWTSVGGRDAANTLAGKYLKTDANDKDFRDLMSFTALSEIVAETLDADGGLTKSDRTRVNGRPAIALTDAAGAKLYVAAEGRPYMLRLSPPGGGESLDFLAYDRAVKIKPPPAALVVS